MVLWTCLVESSIVDAHSPLNGLHSNKDGIGEPVGVENLLNESSRQELGDLFTNGPAPLIVKTTQALLGGL